MRIEKCGSELARESDEVNWGQVTITHQDRESALTIGRFGINRGPLLFGFSSIELFPLTYSPPAVPI